MSSENANIWTMTITALDSGIEYESLNEAPDEPLLVEMVGIQPEHFPVLSRRFGIDLEDLEDLTDLDERPRVQIEDDFAMIVVRVPVDLEKKEREYSTYPVGLFTDGDSLLIMKHAQVPIRRKGLHKKAQKLMTPPEIIYNLWEVVIHSFETMLDVIEDTIKKTEDTLQAELYPSGMNRFYTLSSDAVYLEAALKSNMRVLRRLVRKPKLGNIELDCERLEELVVDLQQQMELGRIYRELIANAMDAYDTIVGHNLNRVIKTLTSISLLVSVPTLIASLFGMNVILPGVNEPSTFLLILLLSLLITTPLLMFLRRKGLV
ncbi:MAG: magnesium transporter CorA family protein [Candidatus Thorarchaeota archaeon]|nr:MAG: magnesium transporter CorA family protein [Candidatus Thorarchaeota archaeon]